MPRLAAFALLAAAAAGLAGCESQRTVYRDRPVYGGYPSSRGYPGSRGGGSSREISDRDVERARDACRDIAHNRGWTVRDTHLRDKDDDRGRVTILVEGDRRGRGDRERECRYNVRTRDAEFDDQS
jgi:hypothetical protein